MSHLCKYVIHIHIFLLFVCLSIYNTIYPFLSRCLFSNTSGNYVKYVYVLFSSYLTIKRLCLMFIQDDARKKIFYNQEQTLTKRWRKRFMKWYNDIMCNDPDLLLFVTFIIDYTIKPSFLRQCFGNIEKF